MLDGLDFREIEWKVMDRGHRDGDDNILRNFFYLDCAKRFLFYFLFYKNQKIITAVRFPLSPTFS